jgi:hypothetical protein
MSVCNNTRQAPEDRVDKSILEDEPFYFTTDQWYAHLEIMTIPNPNPNRYNRVLT